MECLVGWIKRSTLTADKKKKKVRDVTHNQHSVNTGRTLETGWSGADGHSQEVGGWDFSFFLSFTSPFLRCWWEVFFSW